MNVVESASKRKACVRCATAKAKCTSNDNKRGCDRCRRLKRECILEEIPRRKKEKQSTRVKALEEKVETLLSLLGSDRGSSGSANADAYVNVHGTSTIDTRTPAPTEDGCLSSRSAKSTAPSTSEDGKHFDVIEHGLLNMATAERLLDKYKRINSKYFPFVIVAPEIDAVTLRMQSPFLFLAIITTCLEGDHLLQRRLGVEMKRILCERVIMGNDRELDLLQGLLVQLGWNHYHFNPMRKQLHMLLQMAVSLVIDLDLDRCPAHRDQRVASNLCCCPSNPYGQSKLPLECRRPPAEIRALLGCFYLCSSMAMLRKELAMTHTQWIDNCLHILEVEQESPTDIYVIALINVRCLVQSIGERFSYDDLSNIRRLNDVVIQMSLNGFKKDIEQLESSPALSPARKNYLLIAELKALSIAIHEVALYRDRDINSLCQNLHLWDLLTSARDFLNYVLSIPTEAMTGLPAMLFNLLPYAIIVLSTVSRMPSIAGWDSTIAKREADAANYGLRIKAKFGDELTTTGADVSIEQKDVWQYFSRGIGGLVAWHQRCETSGAGDDVNVPISSPSATIKCGMADTLTAFTSMWFRKPLPFNLGGAMQEQGGGSVAIANEVSSRAEAQQDMSMNLWDEEAWQSILDDFSMFPTTAGVGPVGLY